MCAVYLVMFFFHGHGRVGTDLSVLWMAYATQTRSNLFQLFHDSSRQQYGVTVTICCSYSCFMLLKMGDSDAPKHVEQLSD